MSLVKRLRDWQSLTKSVTDEAADRIEELEKGWISVEDALPDEETEKNCISFANSKVWSGVLHYEATHWMPLPSPPEQDND